MPRSTRCASRVAFCALLAAPLSGQASNQALDVGQNSVMRVLAHPSLEPTGPFTVECWIKARGAIDHGRIVRKSHDYQPGYHLSFSWQSNRVTADYYTDRVYYVRDTQQNFPYLGTWHHLAFSATPGGEMRLYVDGELRNTAPAPPQFTHSADLIVGGADFGALGIQEEYLGLVDELRFWSVERTREQIAADRFVSVWRGNGLVSVWHFDGDLRDAIGSNHGVLVGNASIVPSDSPVRLEFELARLTGAWNGGDTLDLNGRFPNGTAPLDLYFGTARSPSFTMVGPELLRAVVPPGAAASSVLLRATYANVEMFGSAPYLYLPRLIAPPAVSLGTAGRVRLEVPPPGVVVFFAGIPPAISLALPPFDGALGIAPPFVELLSGRLTIGAAELTLYAPFDPSAVGIEVLFQALFLLEPALTSGTFTNLGRIVITP